MKKSFFILFKLDNVFFCLCAALAFSCLVFTPLKLNSLASVTFYLTYFVILIWFILKIICILKIGLKKGAIFEFINKNSLLVCLFSVLFITLFCVLIKTIGHTINPTFYFNKLLIFWETLFFIYCVLNASLSKKSLLIVFCLVFGYVFFIVIAFILGFLSHYSAQSSWTFNTFNYSNSNAAGICFSVIICWCVLEMLIFKSKILKVLSLLCSIIMFIFLIMTGYRGCFIAFIFSFLVVFILFYCKRIKSIVLSLSVLLPILFATGYFLLLCLLKKGSFSSANLVILGKSFETRYLMFYLCFIICAKNPIFGNYFEAGNGNGAFQYHNGYLDIVVGYGLFGFIVFIIFLWLLFHYICKEQHKLSFVGLIIVYFSLYLSLTEGSPFYSPNCSFIFMLSPLILFNPSMINALKLNSYKDFIVLNI